MKPSPFLWIKGRDMYQGGKGHMLIKLLGLVPVVDAEGSKLDQATLLRYLSEIVWFPSAAVSDYISWEPVDDNSARATLTYGGTSVSAVFYFDETGALTNMIAQRYRMVNKDLVLDTWETPAGGDRDMGGATIAARGEAVWKLSSGDLSYARLEITEIEYNNPALY
jgi:hypothetical protein